MIRIIINCLILLSLMGHCAEAGSFQIEETTEQIRQFIQSFGSFAIVVYVLLYTLNTFSPFFPPIIIMSLLAGVIFGPVVGTFVLTLGIFTGTSAVFFSARYIGGKWVQKFIKGKNKELYDKLSENGFFILLPARLIGFPPYGIIDAMCGLSRIRYIDFILATLIGGIPWVVAQVLLADRFANFDPKDPVLWGLLIVFIAMIVVTGKIVKIKQTKNERTHG